MIGTIANLASGNKKGLSTMQVEVSRFVKVIGIQAVVMACILAIVGFSTKGETVDETEIIDVLVNAFVGVLVANIPQGAWEGARLRSRAFTQRGRGRLHVC
jgi:hypothetical protein